MRWTVVTYCDSFFVAKVDTAYYNHATWIRKCDRTFITYCDKYYKVRWYTIFCSVAIWTSYLSKSLAFKWGLGLGNTLDVQHKEHESGRNFISMHFWKYKLLSTGKWRTSSELHELGKDMHFVKSIVRKVFFCSKFQFLYARPQLFKSWIALSTG